MFNWNKIKKWVYKDQDIPFTPSSQPKFEKVGDVKRFYLHLEDMIIGELSFVDNRWSFKYSDEFKLDTNELNLIVGFPDLDKVYYSQELWPFFKIRIPGLKQPIVKEIIKRENIEINNHVKLLERFGKKSISNPYELDVV